jgi:hypothetical protein
MRTLLFIALVAFGVMFLVQAAALLLIICFVRPYPAAEIQDSEFKIPDSEQRGAGPSDHVP